MPRMFDLLRGGNPQDDDNNNGNDKRSGSNNNSGKEINFPKQILNKNSDKNTYNNNHKNKIIGEEKTKEFYDKALSMIIGIIEKSRKNENIEYELNNIIGILDELFEILSSGDAILSSVYEPRKEEYYLPYHITNVLILASFLGLKLGLNKSKLKDLGLACIFCDIGLDYIKDVVDKPSKLTTEEFKKVKTHIDLSVKVINQMTGINDIVKSAIKMHHERVDGSGYPNGYHSDRINTYAKIIGLVDTYEAMTHKRSYREGNNGHRIIKLLLSSLKGGFDYEVMRLLINTMSVYPIGTIVELDSGEIARVVGVKPGSPLRPLISIIQDSDGNIIKETQIIDLSTCESPSIINSL